MPGFSRAVVSGIALLSLVIVLGTAPTAPAQGVSAAAAVNDWSCRPSTAHPRPVVLLHGLNARGDQHWALHGPAIAKAGYCVFAPTYSADRSGNGGQAPIRASAREVGAFVDRVLATTRSTRVDLVGHSLGGFVALYMTKFSGYRTKVRRIVALTAPARGTTVFGAIPLSEAVGLGPVVEPALTASCIACAEMVVGGPAQVRLGRGPIAQPGVRYTMIASRFDAVVTPTANAFVREPGVRNYYIQDRCPLDPVGHFGIGFDSGVTSMILNGLDPSVPIRCSFGPPI